jgi:hypothetical protein
MESKFSSSCRDSFFKTSLMRVYIYMCVCVCVYIYIYMYTHVCICVCVHTLGRAGKTCCIAKRKLHSLSNGRLVQKLITKHDFRLSEPMFFFFFLFLLFFHIFFCIKLRV